MSAKINDKTKRLRKTAVLISYYMEAERRTKKKQKQQKIIRKESFSFHLVIIKTCFNIIIFYGLMSTKNAKIKFCILISFLLTFIIPFDIIQN